MKQTYYFSHDYHARNDLKLQALSMEQTGIYWCLVEMLYEENGYIKFNLCERIAIALRTQCDTINTVIRDFELFEYDEERFWSKSVLRRLEKINEKSKKAQISAQKRWGGCERIAVKEIKGNKIKGNIYPLALGITFWNERAKWPSDIPTPPNTTVKEKLLTICRGETGDITMAWNKIKPSRDDWELAVRNYIKEIANRAIASDYSKHRFSFFDFIKQSNGYKKFLNR